MSAQSQTSFWHWLGDRIWGGITRQKAIAIARAELERRGIKWNEPVVIQWGWVSYGVWTNADVLGGNNWVRVRRRDGYVLDVGNTLR